MLQMALVQIGCVLTETDMERNGINVNSILFEIEIGCL